MGGKSSKQQVNQPKQQRQFQQGKKQPNDVYISFDTMPTLYIDRKMKELQVQQSENNGFRQVQQVPVQHMLPPPISCNFSKVFACTNTNTAYVRCCNTTATIYSSDTNTNSAVYSSGANTDTTVYSNSSSTNTTVCCTTPRTSYISAASFKNHKIA